MPAVDIYVNNWDYLDDEAVTNSIISIFELYFRPNPPKKYFSCRGKRQRRLDFTPIVQKFRNFNPFIYTDNGTCFYVEFKINGFSNLLYHDGQISTFHDNRFLSSPSLILFLRSHDVRHFQKKKLESNASFTGHFSLCVSFRQRADASHLLPLLIIHQFTGTYRNMQKMMKLDALLLKYFPNFPYSDAKTFPLLQLPPILLKQVIEKLESRSYLRLQQTCRQLEEFIQSTPIQIDVENWFILEWKGYRQFEISQTRNTASLLFSWTPLKEETATSQVLDFKSLLGVRFRCLIIKSNGYADISTICKVLNKYRITSASVCFHTGSTVQVYRSEWIQLFQVLKPFDSVFLDHCAASEWDAVLSLKTNTLKKMTLITVNVRGKQAFAAATKLLSHTSCFVLFVNDWDYLVEEEDASNIFISVLELFLCPKPPRNSFIFRGIGRRSINPDPVIQCFHNYNPSALIKEHYTLVTFKIDGDCRLYFKQDETIAFYKPVI